MKWAALGIVSLAAFLAAVSLARVAPSHGQSQTLVVVSGGGSYEEAIRKTILEPFERDTGVKIIYQSPALEAKLKVQVDSGNVEWDVVEIRGTPFRADVAKYLEPIDYSVFSKDVLESLALEARRKYGVGSETYSTVMAFSTRAYPAGRPRPKNWAEFWDVKRFPGPRSLQTAAAGYPCSIPFALLAAGVPKESLYPLDLDKAFASLDKIKPHIVKWWNLAAEPGQLLVDREVGLISGYNGRLDRLKADGAPVEIEWNEGEMTMIFWVVPKGARNKAAAMRFIAFASEAKVQAALQNIMFYGPTNRKAFDYLDRTVVERLPTSPANGARQFWRNDEWLEALTPSGKTNLEVIIDRWNQWVLK